MGNVIQREQFVTMKGKFTYPRTYGRLQNESKAYCRRNCLEFFKEELNRFSVDFIKEIVHECYARGGMEESETCVTVCDRGSGSCGMLRHIRFV